MSSCAQQVPLFEKGRAKHTRPVTFHIDAGLRGFKGADHFYNVVVHEITHSTGHPSRLARDLKNRFGSRASAAEELVAKLGAAFLSAEFGFDGDVCNADYIASWMNCYRQTSGLFYCVQQGASRR